MVFSNVLHMTGPKHVFWHKCVFPAMSTFSLPSGREGGRGSDFLTRKACVSEDIGQHSDRRICSGTHTFFPQRCLHLPSPRGGGGEGAGLPLRQVVSQNASTKQLHSPCINSIFFTAMDIFGYATNTSLRAGEHLALKCCCCVN